MSQETWTTENDFKLAKYIANCDKNELPDRETMQGLLKECVEEIKRLKGNGKESLEV